MGFMIPLKFSDGDIVRNTEQLKKKYSTNYKDIFKFIESGELERFFSCLDKNDMKSMIESMKKEGMKGSEIVKKLADALGVELNIADEHELAGGIVRHSDELKSTPTCFSANFVPVLSFKRNCTQAPLATSLTS